MDKFPKLRESRVNAIVFVSLALISSLYLGYDYIVSTQKMK